MKHNAYNYIHNEKGLKGLALVFSCNKNDEILVEGLLKSFDKDYIIISNGGDIKIDRKNISQIKTVYNW